MTLRQIKGRLGNLTVAVVGDVLHSRVARSILQQLTNGLARIAVLYLLCGQSAE